MGLGLFYRAVGWGGDCARAIAVFYFGRVICIGLNIFFL